MNSRLLTTAETAAWFTERGVPRTIKTLEAMRVRGGDMAPPFRKFGRTVRYAEEDLESWFEYTLSQPVCSTTEAAGS